MSEYKQLSLFPGIRKNDSQPASSQTDNYYVGRDLGTFRDSLRAPIHRWFRYPAGYSFKFVLESFELFNVSPGNWVYDPFSGTGTTLICAKQRNIHAYGTEAHSFVHWVAQVKLRWELDLKQLGTELERLVSETQGIVGRGIEEVQIKGAFPELVHKCYHPFDLQVLYVLREQIQDTVADPHNRDFFKLAVTDALRGAAAAGTGWPYIAPRKNTGGPPKNALKVFQNTARLMLSDLYAMKREAASDCIIHNVLGDSRQTQSLADEQVRLALTSPPYLNNYDYADRTRLETYFWGIAESWSDITEQFRDKLMIAATTQITRGKYQVETALSSDVAAVSPAVYQTIQQAVLELAEIRPQKGGKKDYDLMVALYFNDMLAVLQETYRLLEPGGHFCLVLGDSAPYGVHVATDRLIGELGLGIGFNRADYHELRRRGGKWKNNPQRHKVALREGIVVLTK